MPRHGSPERPIAGALKDDIGAAGDGCRGPRVSVVIPNWNGAVWLVRCLRSLRDQSYRDFELILVDNASTDDSRLVLEREYPEARWVPLSHNRGFAAAVNAGIRVARGDLIALLNNDTEVEPGWLASLVDALDRRPDVAFAASRMRSASDRNRIDGAGDAMNWYASPSKIGMQELDDGRFDVEREVFGACAGAAIYRRELFGEIGLFEESFFAYIEDVDVSFRAQLAGLRCLYVPAAVVYHVGSATAGRNSSFALRLATRNQLLLVVRNYPWPYIWSKLPKVLHSQYWIARGALDEGRLPVVLSAYLAFVLQLPRALAARRRIQARRRVPLARLDEVLDRCEHWESPRLRSLRHSLASAVRPRRGCRGIPDWSSRPGPESGARPGAE
jgi:GT2 family glycosyltransferase